MYEYSYIKYLFNYASRYLLFFSFFFFKLYTLWVFEDRGGS